MTPPDSAGSGSVSPDAVAERAVACHSVARVSAGPFGEVATYLPGRRVPGVRLVDGTVEVHVVARWGVRMVDLASEVRAAVGAIAAGLVVDVHVDDVELTEEAERTDAPPSDAND